MLSSYYVLFMLQSDKYVWGWSSLLLWAECCLSSSQHTLLLEPATWDAEICNNNIFCFNWATIWVPLEAHLEHQCAFVVKTGHLTSLIHLANYTHVLSRGIYSVVLLWYLFIMKNGSLLPKITHIFGKNTKFQNRYPWFLVLDILWFKIVRYMYYSKV